MKEFISQKPKTEIDENSQESKGKQKISIEINGVQIEGEKYYFEYPKNIQEETGILGYERTKVSNETLSNFAVEYYLNKHNINLKDYGFTNIESIDEFNKINEKRMNSMPKNNRGVYVDGYLESNKFKIDEALRCLDRNILNNLIYSLSNGEYPNKSLTHEMGADFTDHPKKQKEFQERFVKSDFFLQKIYDLEYIKDQVESTRKSEDKYKIFNMANTFGHNEDKSHVTIFDKNTGEKVNNGDFIHIAELASKKYYEGIKDGKYFACTPDSGLNIDTGSFYFRHGVGLSNKKPCFGFPMSNDSYFKKYLDKALDIYVKELKSVDLKEMNDKYSMRHGIGALVQELVLSNQDIHKFLYSLHNEQEYMQSIDEDGGEKYDAFCNLANKIIEDIEIGHNIKLGDYIDKDKLIKKISNNRSSGDYELKLPVFIGHEEIPQLSWGHAKYAHYMNEKGLNFFKFKHADHLPIKK